MKNINSRTCVAAVTLLQITRVFPLSVSKKVSSGSLERVEERDALVLSSINYMYQSEEA